MPSLRTLFDLTRPDFSPSDIATFMNADYAPNMRLAELLGTGPSADGDNDRTRKLLLLMAQNERARQEGAMPQRNIMNVPAQPFGKEGIHGYPFPGARLPNAYRGPLTPQGQPGVPDAPEYYVPGFEKQFLRGT